VRSVRFLILRALGELVLHRPSSGSVVSYAREFLGERPLRGRVVPRAINSVVFRIAVFYVGSLVLLALLLPYNAYKQSTSPFVTFFSSIGVPAAGEIVNFVVLTAALSSLNAGLYSPGRILRPDGDERQRTCVHREDGRNTVCSSPVSH
jgi:L-asparagine permease